MGEVRFDEIGYWSEVKLDIVKEYATAYSTILTKQPGLHHVYIDGFAGAGVHIQQGHGGVRPRKPPECAWRSSRRSASSSSSTWTATRSAI